jgi:hypothetical protein
LAAASILCCAQETKPAASPGPSTDGSSAVNPLENWIDALAIAESGNRGRLVHRDRDGQLYYGCLQFQPRTFRAYVRKFHLLPNAGRKETMSRIYDCAFQKQLAALMIRSDPAGWKHWRGTVENRVGLPPVSSAGFQPAEGLSSPTP